MIRDPTQPLAPRQPPELQSAALASLARSKSVDVAKSLLANYRSFAPGLRTQTSDILLSRDAWREELLVALEAKHLSPADLDAATRQRLLDHKTKAVAERAAKILAVDLNSDRAKVVAGYLPAVRAGGDAQLGSQLFVKMCAQCHKLGDVGHAVGPDLMSLTDKSADAMITAVLDPNRAVETKFLQHIDWAADYFIREELVGEDLIPLRQRIQMIEANGNGMPQPVLGGPVPAEVMQLLYVPGR